MPQPQIEHTYYFGSEAEQYVFYRFPKALFMNEYYAGVSDGAKILYGLMLDRMGLSIKNGWLDAHGRVFIFFTLEDVQEAMHCGHNKGVKIMSELENIDLIDRVKQGQGKPTIIYVKKFMSDAGSPTPKGSTDTPCQEPSNQQQKQGIRSSEFQTSEKGKSGQSKPTVGDMKEFASDGGAPVPKTEGVLQPYEVSIPQENSHFPKTEIQTSEKGKSRPPICGSADCRKADTNKTEYNQTEKNNTESIPSYPPQGARPATRTDGWDRDGDGDGNPNTIQRQTEKPDADQCRREIRRQIDYYAMIDLPEKAENQINEMVELMVETQCFIRSTILIAGNEYPAQMVKDRFAQLTHKHIEYVMGCLESNTTKMLYLVQDQRSGQGSLQCALATNDGKQCGSATVKKFIIEFYNGIGYTQGVKEMIVLPNIKPISELRNYGELLRDVTVGSPVFLTKNGHGKYAIMDMHDYEKLQTTLELMNEIARGRKTGEEKGWVSMEDALARLGISDA